MSGFFGNVGRNGGLVEAEIWRATNSVGNRQWGGYDPGQENVPIRALSGRTKVASAMAVMEPRTTRADVSSGQVDGVTITGVTLYFPDFDLDIRSDDMVAFVNHKGVYEAWKVEGEGGTNNYVSPFSGIVGGREVFLTRNKVTKQ